MREIIGDSLRYPFSNLRHYFILGIILVIGDFLFIPDSLFSNSYIQLGFLIVSFIIGLLVNGYLFRVLGTSFDGSTELPGFNNLKELCKDGIKVLLVCFVYFCPVLLIIITYALFSDLGFNFLEGSGVNILNYYSSTVLGIFLNLNDILSMMLVFAGETNALFGMFYLILVTPLMLMAIATMADYNGEFRAAFRLREIIEDTTITGWGKLIIWFIIIIFVSFIISSLGFIETYILSLINFNVLTQFIGVLFTLLISPFYYLFIARSLALFYVSE